MHSGNGLVLLGTKPIFNNDDTVPCRHLALLSHNELNKSIYLQRVSKDHSSDLQIENDTDIIYLFPYEPIESVKTISTQYSIIDIE